MKHLLNPTVEAKTLAVLMKSSTSITCWVSIDCGEGEESANVSLNFENDEARILGYPQSWKLWSDDIEGNEEFTYEDAEHDGSVDDGIHEMAMMSIYVSKETEIAILTQLKASLEKQFEDEMFKDELTLEEKNTALTKINVAISNLHLMAL